MAATVTAETPDGETLLVNGGQSVEIAGINSSPIKIGVPDGQRIDWVRTENPAPGATAQIAGPDIVVVTTAAPLKLIIGLAPTVKRQEWSFAAAWIDGTQSAMEAEGVDPATIRRVINRLLYGGPHSPAEIEAQADIEAVSDGRITMAYDDDGPRLRWNA